MPAFTIVEPEIVSNTQPGFGNRIVGLEIYLLVFQATPQALHKHIIYPTALAVHAHLDACCLENAGKGITGKLGTLIRVEDLRVTIATDGSLQRLHTEVRIHRVGYPPGQDLATVTDVLEYSRKLSELKVNHCKMKIIELVKHMENL